MLQREGVPDGLLRLDEHPPPVGGLQRPLEEELLRRAALRNLRTTHTHIKKTFK